MAEVQGRDVSISGMTEPEAREFHSIFVTSFIIFHGGRRSSRTSSCTSGARGCRRSVATKPRWTCSITLITSLA